ncbi:hypothetical protein ACFX15_041668 [Malus domestica]
MEHDSQPVEMRKEWKAEKRTTRSVTERLNDRLIERCPSSVCNSSALLRLLGKRKGDISALGFSMQKQKQKQKISLLEKTITPLHVLITGTVALCELTKISLL